MAINIKNKRSCELAYELSSLTKKNITKAITEAMEMRLLKIKQQSKSYKPSLKERIKEVSLHCSSLPMIDKRTPDEILGYDSKGLLRDY